MLFPRVVIRPKLEREEPETEHFWVVHGQERAGGNERGEHETGQGLGAEEEHNDGNKETGSQKAVVNTKLGGGLFRAGLIS